MTDVTVGNFWLHRVVFGGAAEMTAHAVLLVGRVVAEGVLASVGLTVELVTTLSIGTE